MKSVGPFSIGGERRFSLKRLKRLLFRPKAIASLVIAALALTPPIIHSMSISQVPLIADPFELGAVTGFKLAETENAFADFAEGHSRFVEFGGEPVDLEEAESGSWDRASEHVKNWVEKNPAFMDAWFRGSTKADAQYKKADEYEFGEELPLITDSRHFQKLASLHSMRLVAEGNPKEASKWLMAALRVSRLIGRHGTAYERVAGYSQHRAALDALVRWAHNASVSSELLSQATRDFQHETGYGSPISECLKIEYLMLSRFLGSASLFEVLRADGESKSEEWFNRMQLFLRGEPELSKRFLRQVFANWLAQADKNLSSRPRRGGSLRLFEHSIAGDNGLSILQLYDVIDRTVVAKNLIPPTSEVLSVVDLEMVREQLILLVLAIEQFERRHGSYPDTLESLVPDFVEEIPTDLYSSRNERLRYRVLDEAVLVYSVGGNQQDDDGLFERSEDIGYRIGKSRE